MGSGAVEIRLRIWLSAWVRACAPRPSQPAEPAWTPRCRRGSWRDRRRRPRGRLEPQRWRLRGRTCPCAGGAGGWAGRPRRRDPLGVEVPGEPRSIGPGALDADELDGAEVAEPAQQLLVAAAVVAKLSTPRSAPRSSRAAATWTSRCVSTPPVMLRAKWPCHPFVGLGWGDTTPAGRRTGQRRAFKAGSYEVTPSHRRVSSG